MPPYRGQYAVVDPHNFGEFGMGIFLLAVLKLAGRYYGNPITDVSGFGTWWQTVAARFKDNAKVIFDTNNEYHDMDNKLVADLNQAAIDGIRKAGATSQYIFVEGNAWSGAWHWVRFR
jgi:endoglucanase